VGLLRTTDELPSSSAYILKDEPKFSRLGVLGDPKRVLEYSRGVFMGFLDTSQPRNKLTEISRNLAGMSSTGTDLVSADVGSQPDVSPLSVVRFGRGKVENLGGRGVKMKKRGRICGVLYDLYDLLKCSQ